MTTDPMRTVRALIAAELKEKQDSEAEGADRLPSGPVVTVSRQYGAGGEEVAQALGARLGVPCFDKEILDRIVENAHVDRVLMEQLDEHFRGTLSENMTSLLTGKSLLSSDYRLHLFNVILAIARHGGVIVGRGAHLILQNRPEVLRVRVVGSLDRRTRRVMAAESMTDREARARTREVDREREIFIHALYKHSEMDPADFDLILNTDRFGIDGAVDMVLRALEERGVEVRGEARAY